MNPPADLPPSERAAVLRRVVVKVGKVLGTCVLIAVGMLLLIGLAFTTVFTAIAGLSAIPTTPTVVEHTR